MDSYRVTVSPSETSTRVRVTHGPHELLRATLPPPSAVSHERAVATVLEGLALWLDATLPVVLSVGAWDACSGLGLADERGVGVCSIFYHVQVIERAVRRRRGPRLRSIDDVSDSRQLSLMLDHSR